MHSEQDVAARRGRLPWPWPSSPPWPWSPRWPLKFLVFGGSGCSGGVTLRVAATPEIVPALREIDNAWQRPAPQRRR